MFLRRSLASLARAVYLHFLSVHLGVLPPPNTKKLATLVTTHTFPLGAPPPPNALTHGTPLTLEQVGNVRESRGVRKMAASTCS